MIEEKKKKVGTGHSGDLCVSLGVCNLCNFGIKSFTQICEKILKHFNFLAFLCMSDLRWCWPSF